MKYAIGIALFVALSASAYASEPPHKKVTDAIVKDFETSADKSIQKFCAQSWPTDFSMQNFCYGENVKARNHAQDFDVMKSNETTMIWAKCMSDWHADPNDEDVMDWVMADHCITEQFTALDNIKIRNN